MATPPDEPLSSMQGTSAANMNQGNSSSSQSQMDGGQSGGQSNGGQSDGGQSGGQSNGGQSDGGQSGGGNTGPLPDTLGTTSAAVLANQLGLENRFAVGLGNDDDNGNLSADKVHAYTLGPKLDIHYMYLSNLNWISWSPNGGYVTSHANAAKANGVVPMFTLYQVAANGEDNDLSSITDASFMTKYWSGVRTLFQRLGEFGSPAIVHLEPDFWGTAQQTKGNDPSKVSAVVTSLVPECTDLPDNVSGMAQCMIRLGRTLAPNTKIGLHASTFGAYSNSNGASDPVAIAKYLVALGAGQSDFMTIETLDRDAGCFEAGKDPNCQRSGTFYWDETNAKSPNFAEHLAWAKAIHDGTGLPLLWWQTPLGVPSTTSGGSASHYRDNRVHYIFTHPDEFVAAGGFGVVFGTGAANQTDVTTDGDQFKNAVTAYLTSPVSLP
ncbi:MAG: hypothetical protein FWD73_02435 [Polyangiaceae bacterium]|nr:hypothetical protein [Polyangiaceae bacterium]